MRSKHKQESQRLNLELSTIAKLMEYPSNVKLLLLQILLRRQQTLAHQDKSLELTELLREPIVDKEALQQFQSHKLVRMYCSELCAVSTRTLKSLVSELFQIGIPVQAETPHDPVTLITLAEYYYSQRIEEIESQQMPELRQHMLHHLES
ncbi:SWC7 (YLR385C) [Zygosaccharomyces parabailii]|nr:SWC7 (YLR385C) [Zygosaccharomyces parabailii]CDH17196.1 related to SWR1-complex protein 7 [Zygosaccharomyces bailii ISA1307]SJM86900.1 related to SWR1-complex protein 7 [Zygosaccharomyces bailii]